MIVGINCPGCHGFVTETYSHPHGNPAFACRKCNVILEPPFGWRKYTAITELPPDEKS